MTTQRARTNVYIHIVCVLPLMQQSVKGNHQKLEVSDYIMKPPQWISQ